MTFSSAAPGPHWTDSHCHLQDLSREDLVRVLERALESGTSRMIVVGTDADYSCRAAELAAAEPPVEGVEIWATVGLHPHAASKGTMELRAVVEAMSVGGLVGSKVVGVGECGLDFHYDYSPRPEQRVAFADQVRLAHELGLALVIHTREAWRDTFAVLESEGVPPSTAFHCFTGGPAEAESCLALGAYLSFSGIVTFPKADDVRAAAALTPLERLLVETDSPLLTPVPHRGKPNEPSYVPLVGEALASLKGLPIGELCAVTSANAAAAFDLT